MGSVARHAKAERFIGAFGSLILGAYPLPAELNPRVEIDDTENVVIVFDIQDVFQKKYPASLHVFFYHPEESAEDVVNNLYDLLHQKFPEEAIRFKLREAKLL